MGEAPGSYDIFGSETLVLSCSGRVSKYNSELAVARVLELGEGESPGGVAPRNS